MMKSGSHGWIHHNSLYGNKSSSNHCSSSSNPMSSPTNGQNTGSSLQSSMLGDTMPETSSVEQNYLSGMGSPDRDINADQVTQKAISNLSKTTSNNTNHSEYSPDSKPSMGQAEESKFLQGTSTQDNHNTTVTSPGCLSHTSSASYPSLSSYPYMSAGGAGYTGSGIFHPADMFKASSLAARSNKKRSTTGEYSIT